LSELCPELLKKAPEEAPPLATRLVFVETPKPGPGSVLPDISHQKKNAEIIDWEEFYRRYPDSTATRNPKIDEENENENN
jgi:hypothetical protein